MKIKNTLSGVALVAAIGVGVNSKITIDKQADQIASLTETVNSVSYARDEIVAEFAQEYTLLAEKANKDAAKIVELVKNFTERFDAVEYSSNNNKKKISDVESKLSETDLEAHMAKGLAEEGSDDIRNIFQHIKSHNDSIKLIEKYAVANKRAFEHYLNEFHQLNPNTPGKDTVEQELKNKLSAVWHFKSQP